MIKLLNCFIVLLLIKLLSQGNVLAELHINEIYPAPPTGEYEWIELYNDQDNEIDLTQYSLFDLANNKIKIPSGFLTQFSFIIATSSSVLNNTGDTVYLKTSNGDMLETVVYSEVFSADKSYLRCPDGGNLWFSSNIITKNSGNNLSCIILTPTDPPIPTLSPFFPNETIIITETVVPTTEPTSTAASQFFNNVFISEVMVNPPTGETEWLELYNDNNYSVTLDNWFIDDIENSGSSPKLFKLTIAPKEFAIVELSSSMFNNDIDNVRLLDFNKNLKDSFEYSKTEKGVSWGRINFDQDQFCFQNPSKNLPNNSCINAVVTPSVSSVIPTKKPAIIVTKINSVPSSIISNQSNIKQQSLTKSVRNKPENILGITTKKSSNGSSRQLIQTLSLISLTHSILTIASLFLKIKIHEAV